jgi:uncharacterized protein YegP (UPF0339 family)
VGVCTGLSETYGNKSDAQAAINIVKREATTA